MHRSTMQYWLGAMSMVLTPFNGIAQDMPPPTYWRWSTVHVKHDAAHVKSAWTEDSIAYSLIAAGSDTILRIEYPSQRSVEVLVNWHWAVDTAYTQDLSTGDMTMVVSSYACWLPSGTYTRFHSSQRIPALRGELRGHIPDGLWSEFDDSGRLQREYMLSGGWPSGPYREYHVNGAIRWEGSYCYVPKSVWVESLITGEMISEVQLVHEKCGTWTQFNPDGKKVLRVNYEWVSE